jgi:hypothetical protein
MEIHIENWSNVFWLFYTIQCNFETNKWIKLINEWNTCQNSRSNWNNVHCETIYCIIVIKDIAFEFW